MRKIVIAGLGRDFHDFNVSSALLGWAGGATVCAMGRVALLKRDERPDIAESSPRP